MKKNAPWLSVPQFGDWDQKGELPDYSLDFSKIREMRKQNKKDVSRASLGNEEELVNPTVAAAETVQTRYQRHHYPEDHHHHYPEDHHHSPTVRFFFSRFIEHNVSSTVTSVQGVLSPLGDGLASSWLAIVNGTAD
ncbi:hypothetical protein SADUNF_Sadunf07G0073100 [Salix dunnii]|uniref:RIN4 pathogenic type III effector avirulence factor Avr cleavage site domain-containing protein n=1 Tax=Salix dunnii TaxID=1413687 RepID=A0A835K5C7_9ROSI|nr:hypothetical protein SADUNF_Sadunf07G0073100 [Salix dunnii]